MIPAFVHKALQLCNSTHCRFHNFRGLVLGFGYKRYKWEWWYMPLTCRLQALNLKSLCDYHKVESLGPGGGLVCCEFGQHRWVHAHTGIFTILVPSVC